MPTLAALFMMLLKLNCFLHFEFLCIFLSQSSSSPFVLLNGKSIYSNTSITEIGLDCVEALKFQGYSRVTR